MRDREAVDSNITRKEDDGDDRQNAKKKKTFNSSASILSPYSLVYLTKELPNFEKKEFLKFFSPPLNYDFFI